MERLLLHHPHLHRHLHEHGRQLAVLLRRVPHRPQGQDSPHFRSLQEVHKIVQLRTKRDDGQVKTNLLSFNLRPDYPFIVNLLKKSDFRWYSFNSLLLLLKISTIFRIRQTASCDTKIMQ